MRRVRVSSHQSPVHKLGDTQMTLSPKFRLATAKSPASCHSFMSPSLPGVVVESSPLIPGLPDDVAMNCLLRLPIKTHVACRLVCQRWYQLLANKECFFGLRKALGFSDPWLFTLASHRCTGKIQWQVLDLKNSSWHTIPAMPCRDRACPRGFGCIAVPSDGTLLVCGGLVSDMDCPLHLVLKYEIYRNRWTVMGRMLTARSFFGSGVIGGRVYVAGGCSSHQFELDSAEVLDPASGTWQAVTSMGTNMASYDSAVLKGKLFVTEGCVWPFLSAPRGQMYDPETNHWVSMPLGMREGWTGSSVVVYDHLFVISEYERMRLKFYNAVSDSWENVEGSSVPERIRKPFSVTSVGSRIVVVGKSLHVAVGQVEKKNCCNSKEPSVQCSFSIQWQEVDAPKEFYDLTPSGCQILYA